VVGSDAVTSPRRPRTADVRTALVDAAVTVLERDGYAGLTVRAVAAEAGVAPMGVYNHLDGKDGLLAAALGRAFERLREATRWHADLPPVEAFRLLGENYRRFALETPVAYGLMFAGAVPGKVMDLVGPHADPAFDELLTSVRIAQREGVVRDGDPRLLAMAIWSAVHGAVSLEITSGDHELTAGGPEVYAGVIAMIERGLAP
jgi:AcrR family transcriptional regulator